MDPDIESSKIGDLPISSPLHLTLPDWSELDTLRGDDLPFVLWPVGPQPLLYHWFDYAHDHRHRKIILHSADRPERIRAAIRDATLWPIEIELIPLATQSEGKGKVVTGLPDSFHHRIEDRPHPGDGWDLIDYWFGLDRDWLDFQTIHTNRNVSHENLGTGCLIDSTAFIREPVQIGDHVFIGPGCHIGPYATIGDGCLIEGHSTIENSRLAPDTFLSAHTELNQAYLEPDRLLNLKHRAVIDSLDILVSVGTKDHHARPTKQPRRKTVEKSTRVGHHHANSGELLSPDHPVGEVPTKLRS